MGQILSSGSLEVSVAGGEKEDCKHNNMAVTILLIGSGGREHALAWKLAQSPSVKSIYVSPGNAGTCSSGKISNCTLNVKSFDDISTFCKTYSIELVVVGPEDPLANGLADHLAKSGIKCFGPCQQAAQIEASKEFAKKFMDQYEIPTARWESFKNAEDAKKHILSAPYDALVVKASGLAAGKGVIVAANREEAVSAVDALKQDKGIASASDVIVIEELLSGEEVSVLCFSDGTNISVMPPAQDHKRLLDGDKGPNTGGMGAYCRCPLVNEKELDYIKTNVLQKTIDGMRNDGIPYVGVLYAGIMLTKDGPKVLEFNCRFGDPETQVILPLLETDLYQIMCACVEGTLNSISIDWSKNKEAAGIVLVSGGYPGTYPKGKVIKGLKGPDRDYFIFHAGTSLYYDDVITSGGRVLAVVAVANTLQDAVNTAQKGCEAIDFEGKFYRSDIARKGLQKRQPEGMTYKSAGVDIESADDLVRKIKSLTKQTMRPEVCGGIGGFGGIFELSEYTDPYLVAKVGNIGDKLKVCQDCLNYEVAGHDLVATSANELLCLGAEPLFFLDTYTCGKLDTQVAAQVISGIAKACKESKCTLIGGETAEMPGMYADGQFDLTAFIRGAVERPNLLPRKEDIVEGDVAIALLSNTLNCNAFDIINSVINKMGLSYKSTAPFDHGHTIEEVLLSPLPIYVQSLLPLLRERCLKAVGYFGKDSIATGIAQLLPETHSLVLDQSKWTVPLVLNWVSENAGLSEQNMIENFNFGIDMLLIVDDVSAQSIIDHLKSFGKKAALIGVVKKRIGGEEIVKFTNSNICQKPVQSKKRLAVITSNEGRNLLSLIDYFNTPTKISDCEIAVVISDEDNQNIKTAKTFNISTMILSSNSSESELDEILTSYHIDVVCLDGYQKMFSSEFMKNWKGKILTIHSSLLPAFNCPNPCKEILSFGGRITGCTVSLVEGDSKFGKIIAQDALYVEQHYTEEELLKKIHLMQEISYPKAIDLYVSGKKRNIQKSLSKITEAKLQSDITKIIKSTARPGFESNSFQGLFDLKASGYKSPYLVSGTDGVGTKLKIAQICNKHDTIGIDLVAMCVNDILTHGAEPLIFMQSYDCGKLNHNTAVDVVSGIAEGCKQANCALIESECTELPDIYLNADQSLLDLEMYDVVGYAEGAVEKENLLPRTRDIQEGDIVIGVASSGVHSNGYSLVRKMVDLRSYRYQDPFPLDKSMTIGEALLTPTKIYVKSILPLMKQQKIKAAAHITGGGLTENIPRVLPADLKVVLDGNTWDMPLVLQWIAEEGRLSEREMLKTFNCGIGMALIIDKKHEQEVLSFLKSKDEIASRIGVVKCLSKGDESVEVQNFKLSYLLQKAGSVQKKKRVGVLISGSGTNLQSLIDYTQNPSNCSQAEIVLVFSNVPDVEGLKRAEKAGIKTRVLSHKGFEKRSLFDMEVNFALKMARVDIVCLAGYMRILSKDFVGMWEGKLLNVHPAILPSFKGGNAHKLCLEAGAKITGCTVHFVEAEVDAGAVIEQAAVRVDESDDIKSLQEKVKVLEHRIYPKALELLASGRIERMENGKIKWKS